MRLGLILLLGVFFTGCLLPQRESDMTWTIPPTAGKDGPMTPSQKAVAEKLTSIWENDTIVLQYGYSEDIKDGRGYTSGRAGFCTGTGDAIMVVRCFDQKFGTGPDNKMHKYVDELAKIDATFEATKKNQAQTAGLDAIGAWVTDWHNTAASKVTGPAFKACQDEIVDKLYYDPAIRYATRIGARFALTKAVLYDSFVNHGEDGAIELGTKASAKAGGEPKTTHDEVRWLSEFLGVRLAVLRSDKVWADAIGRVLNYQKILEHRNVELDHQIRTMKTSSGYTIFTIDP